VRSARGAITAPVRVTDIREGVVFVPFHYGYWDTDHPHRPADDDGRAANELTPTTWDPVSKQPLFKSGAVVVERMEAR
jgi:anaerobic selenocysteine-containing dehydrogenase